MAEVALNDATIAETTANNHITYESKDYIGESSPYCVQWNPITGACIATNTDPMYDWKEHKTSAKVKGKAIATVTNVKFNGKSPVVMGDKTTESDTYTIPSGGRYKSGAHTSAQGSVATGNNSKVFVNGKSVAINGSKVTTHAKSSSTINGGVSSTVKIGS